MVRLIFFVEFAGCHAVKFVEEHLSLGFGLSLHGLCHHAGRSFGNRAARAFEAHFLHLIAFNMKINIQLIAAQRVIAFSLPVCIFQLVKIARLLVVVEDDLLIKLGQFGHSDYSVEDFVLTSAMRSFSTSARSCFLPTASLLIIRSTRERKLVSVSPMRELTRCSQARSKLRPVKSNRMATRFGARSEE